MHTGGWVKGEGGIHRNRIPTGKLSKKLVKTCNKTWNRGPPGNFFRKVLTSPGFSTMVSMVLPFLTSITFWFSERFFLLPFPSSHHPVANLVHRICSPTNVQIYRDQQRSGSYRKNLTGICSAGFKKSNLHLKKF
jgi:hypothetical protein